MMLATMANAVTHNQARENQALDSVGVGHLPWPTPGASNGC